VTGRAEVPPRVWMMRRTKMLTMSPVSTVSELGHDCAFANQFAQKSSMLGWEHHAIMSVL